MPTAFSFEVPIAHLDDFADLQDYHFCLSMLCRDDRYFKHFHQLACKDHRQVWLDNSFNEQGKADQLEELVDLFTELGAHKLVVPDDPAWTTEQMKLSYHATTFHLDYLETITVVKSPEMRQELSLLGAQHFALSYHIRLPAYKQWLTSKREVPKYELFRWASDMHFLGLCDIDEIQALRPPTCDTSMPIKIALQGLELHQWYELGCPHIHTKDICEEFFSCNMTNNQIHLARRNIIELKEVCNGQ
jgi:hypothetical protein